MVVVVPGSISWSGVADMAAMVGAVRVMPARVRWV
jgi:hypothetical protein